MIKIKIDVRKLIAAIKKRNPYVPKTAIARALGVNRQRLHQMQTVQNSAFLDDVKRRSLKKAFYSGAGPEFDLLIESVTI